MGRAGEKVAAHVVRQRDVGLGVRADQVRRFAQIPEFQRAEGVENLRAGLCGRATIQQAGGFAMPRVVLVIAPPEHAFAARLVAEPRIRRATAKRKLSAI